MEIITGLADLSCYDLRIRYVYDIVNMSYTKPILSLNYSDFKLITKKINS